MHHGTAMLHWHVFPVGSCPTCVQPERYVSAATTGKLPSFSHSWLFWGRHKSLVCHTAVLNRAGVTVSATRFGTASSATTLAPTRSKLKCRLCSASWLSCVVYTILGTMSNIVFDARLLWFTKLDYL